MNSSSYMDKQITELSKSRTRSLLNDEDEAEDDQDHAFNFHPIHSSQLLSKSLDGTPIRGWSSMDQIDSAKFSGEKIGSSSDVELISSIEQKLKEHADVLLHSMECLSARVSQMETRTRQVENAFDDLKEAIEFNHGRTSGKLMELENILLEVQNGVKDLRDKQEIAEAQLLLAKLQVSKSDPQPEKKSGIVEPLSSTEALSSVSQPSNQPPAAPAVCPPPPPVLSSSPTNLPLQNYPPTTPAYMMQQVPIPSVSHLPTAAATAPQLPSQLPQSIVPSVPHPQQESFYSLPVSTPGTSHQHYAPPGQQSQPSPQTHQPYQPPPHLSLNSHLSQLPQPQVPQPFTVNNPRVDSYHLEDLSYVPSHGIQKSSQPHERPPPQYYNISSPQRTHDQHANFRYSESTSANMQVQGLQTGGYPNNMDYHYNSPTHSSSSAMKPFQPSLSTSVSGGEINYSRLPTARVLPHAIPTASTVDSRSSSSGSGNRVPVDDVIDKVVAMGFRRDVVRTTVNKLVENGQPADLNVVLDKLMNNM